MIYIKIEQISVQVQGHQEDTYLENTYIVMQCRAQIYCTKN